MLWIFQFAHDGAVEYENKRNKLHLILLEDFISELRSFHNIFIILIEFI